MVHILTNSYFAPSLITKFRKWNVQSTIIVCWDCSETKGIPLMSMERWWINPFENTVFSRSTVFQGTGENDRWMRENGKSEKPLFLTEKIVHCLLLLGRILPQLKIRQSKGQMLIAKLKYLVANGDLATGNFASCCSYLITVHVCFSAVQVALRVLACTCYIMLHGHNDCKINHCH
jgi:hypothetical protein